MPRVLIGGTFDPLHGGHLSYITAAQKHGRVSCALSDNPAKHPPLVPIEDRARLLNALGCQCVIHSMPNVAHMLESIKFTAYIKGKDWEGRLPAAELRAAEASWIPIIYTDTVSQSSSALLAHYERRRNVEKLAAFERFVQAQVPASKPWEPVTDYSFEARQAIEGPHAKLIAQYLIPCEDANVLDVGCGPGHLVKLLQKECATEQVSIRGVDLPSMDISKPIYFDGDLGCADLVICREVLEHLTVRQLTVAVRNLVKLSSRFVYVTTRFTGDAHLLDVDGSDSLDPTHITLLNPAFLRTLFVLEGCTRRADLEQQLDWRKLGRCLVYEVPA